ncbi:hypothetical protein CSAL01_06228 [Colletotrichum salicis]|uniref:Uncharacterized protein n=1 Tax=Colletotrichum salicis TaxID=1209931 RepID=A0A135V3B7_9PEZI|nr:hypothetical protein CSAL01_06228 [Colletotrichum salicis]
MTSRAIAAFGRGSYDYPRPVSVPLHWDQHQPKVPTPNAVLQVTIPVYLGALFFDAPRHPKNKARVLLRSHCALLRGDITGREHRPNPQFSVEPVGQGPPTDAYFWGRGWLFARGARLLRLCLSLARLGSLEPQELS